MICPKCGHERTSNDDPLIPSTQCPSCGIIYAKFRATNDQHRLELIKKKAERERFSSKSVDLAGLKPIALTLAAVVVVVILWSSLWGQLAVFAIAMTGIIYLAKKAQHKSQEKQPVKQRGMFFWLITVLFVLGFVQAFNGGGQSSTKHQKPIVQAKVEPKPKPTPKPLTESEKIERQFSVWNGEHHNLVRLVKKAMHDPDSFEHVETNYGRNGDGTINVLMVYRGKNGFGGLVLNRVKAQVDIESGTVLRIH